MADKPRPVGKRIGYLAVRAITVVANGLARVLPLSWLRAIATGFGYLLCLLIPSRQRMAAENIRKAFGDRFTTTECRQIARRATINIAKTMLELLKMQYLRPEQVEKLVSLEGLEHLQAPHQRGQGVILLTAHFGNWELGGARITAERYPMVVIARDASEHFSASVINRARTRHNMTVIGREDLRAMIRALRSNNILAILPDQHAARGGIVVDFLGRPAATAPGPAVLALRTGCAIVPFFAYRQPNGTLHTRLFPPLEFTATANPDKDIRALTQKINQTIGAQIAEHPEQWLWLHNRWKAVNTDSPT